MGGAQLTRYIQVAVVCLVAVSAGFAQPDKTIYRISIAERADGKGHVVRLHSRGTVTVSDLSVGQDDLGSARVVVRNAATATGVVKGTVAGPIRSYTIAEVDNGVLLKLSLNPERPVRIVSYPDRDSDDALVALSYANVAPNPSNRTPESAEMVSHAGTAEAAENLENPASAIDRSQGSATADQLPAEEPSSTIVLASTPAVRTGKEAIQSGAVPGSEIAGEAWKLDCVVVDPGHGGKDPGAIANGVREKDVNLAVAKKLGFYIEDRLGLRVVYTRTDDRFVPLRERGRIANEECGKLFISLHVNAARRRSASGTEIYFLGLHKTDAAREVMERENGVIRLESNPELYVDLSSEQAIMETLAQSVYLRESELLAGLVHSQFRDRAMRPTRGVKQAGFLVLWKASMPAILVELGFATNKAEARYLNSRRGHDLLASAIFRAVRAYRDAYARGFEWAVERHAD